MKKKTLLIFIPVILLALFLLRYGSVEYFISEVGGSHMQAYFFPSEGSVQIQKDYVDDATIIIPPHTIASWHYPPDGLQVFFSCEKVESVIEFYEKHRTTDVQNAYYESLDYEREEFEICYNNVKFEISIANEAKLNDSYIFVTILDN